VLVAEGRRYFEFFEEVSERANYAGSTNAYRADVNGGAADATAGRFLILFFAGTAGMV
jgi:hypothetical protein